MLATAAPPHLRCQHPHRAEPCHPPPPPSPPPAPCRCHVILANLRPAGAAKGYAIPRGFLFNLITCPNYTAEILGWVAFTVATQTAAAGLFTLVGAAQMAQWAIGKHKRLLKVRGREVGPGKRGQVLPWAARAGAAGPGAPPSCAQQCHASAPTVDNSHSIAGCPNTG